MIKKIKFNCKKIHWYLIGHYTKRIEGKHKAEIIRVFKDDSHKVIKTVSFFKKYHTINWCKKHFELYKAKYG